MKSLRLAIITALVALLPFGKPEFFGFLNLYPNRTSVLAATKESLDFSEIANIAKKITVRLEGAGDPGSGVIVKKNGNSYTVLTAWHVVKDNRIGEELGIITSDEKEHLWESKSLKRLGEVDMAIITFISNKKYQVATIGDVKSLSSGNTIFVSGFPLPTSSVPVSIWRFLKGDVIANARVPIIDGYQLLYSNPTLPGMSGGPVLNLKGELVGIHGRAEINDRASREKQKLIASGTNQAVPIIYYQKLVKGEKITMEKIQEKSADDYLAQARALFTEKGKEKEIMQLLNKSLEREKTKGAYILRGYFKSLYLNEPLGAILDYTMAIEIDPKHTSAYTSRGAIKGDLKDYKGAFEDFTKAIELNPGFAMTYHNLGIAKNRLGDQKGAIEDFTKAIEIDPEYADPLIGRGVAKHHLGDQKGAIEDFTKAIEIKPENFDAFFNRGLSKAFFQDYKGALEDFTKAIEINPRLSLEDFTKAIEINPRLAAAYYNRSTIKAKLKDYEGAFEDIAKVIEINPNHAGAFYSRGILKFKLFKDYQGAINDYTKATELNPEYAEAFINRGDIKNILGDKKGACNDFKRALSLGNEYITEWFLGKGADKCRNMLLKNQIK